MFALRLSRYDGNQQPSGKPDGMFIRNDGLCTDNTASAAVFTTEDEAKRFFSQQNRKSSPVFIVEVETKQVISKVTKNFVRLV